MADGVSGVTCAQQAQDGWECVTEEHDDCTSVYLACRLGSTYLRHRLHRETADGRLSVTGRSRLSRAAIWAKLVAVLFNAGVTREEIQAWSQLLPPSELLLAGLTHYSTEVELASEQHIFVNRPANAALVWDRLEHWWEPRELSELLREMEERLDGAPETDCSAGGESAADDDGPAPL